ncbi:MAG: hypothetical protein M0T74_17290 [Desulfitobacterium hafniense]|nr:hypothetical protein [Desulfitobacterium hafniense]
MIFQLLLALSLRFFLFDFVLFKGIRESLKRKGYFFRKLLGCPFCQGFWCGLGVRLAYNSFSISVEAGASLISFGFVSAYLGLIVTVAIQPFIERYERHSDNEQN